MKSVTQCGHSRNNNLRRCRERNILLPTFDQMKHPDTIPEWIKEELTTIGLWDVHPRNLFRITWANEPVVKGGGFGGINYLVLPPQLTGVEATIIALTGKWFPTGAHKVGATYGCLVPRLVDGLFDSTSMKAVWPSTGNYCRGGAYVSALLGCESIAILPEEMSEERFQWLSNIAGEVIATPGCESNVKEIFDACKKLEKTRDDILIFNQFDEFGNHLWHYDVTSDALEQVLEKEKHREMYYAGLVLASGSAGTLGAGDRMKELHPDSKVAVAEALQCPTLLYNGYGGHRIEGIGDKHVPWIHNVRNTDLVIGVDDEATIRLMRLFNEPAGQELLSSSGVPDSSIEQLPLMGISSIGNMVAAIKFAKYFQLSKNDIVLTVFTDSMELYGSRIEGQRERLGNYTREQAIRDQELINSIGIEHTIELSYYDRLRIHNLKYFTWVEQMGKSVEELNAQWFDHRTYWNTIHRSIPDIDGRIEAFNREITSGH